MSKQRTSGFYWFCGILAVLFLAGCFHHVSSPPPPEENLNWEDPSAKTYTPGAIDSVAVAFGINEMVDTLPSGDLPITVEKTLVNDGATPIAGGYLIEETVLGMNFLAVAGHAGYVPGDPATQTVFSCTQPGPALDPGESALVSFTLGGVDCPPVSPPLAALTCGVYQETMTADSSILIPESNENDNEDEHYFYVPSNTLQININTIRNPNATPNTFVVGTTVKIAAFALPFPPPAPTVVTHSYTTSILPAGTYTVNARSPVVSSISGASCALAPGMPATAPPNVAGTFTCTIPDPSFTGPICNSILANVPVFEENLNTKLTAISADGCVIRQKTLQVALIFECNP